MWMQMDCTGVGAVGVFAVLSLTEGFDGAGVRGWDGWG